MPRQDAQLQSEPYTLVLQSKQPSIHRRTHSTTVTSSVVGSFPHQEPSATTAAVVPQHSRSISMPYRRSTYDEYNLNSDSDSDDEENGGPRQSPPFLSTGDPTADPKALVPLRTQSLDVEPLNRNSDGGLSSSGGWWDVISAVEREDTAPWQDNSRSSMIKRSSSSAVQSIHSLSLPPGAEPASPLDFQATYPDFTRLDIDLTLDSPSRGQYSPPLAPTPPRRPSAQSSPGRGYSALGIGSGMNRNGGGGTPSSRTSPGPRTSLSRSAQASSERIETRPPPPPVPSFISRPSFPSPGTSPMTAPALLPSPQPSSPPVSGKSKFGFGRSMSLAISKKKDKEREKGKEMGKEGDMDKENEKSRWRGEKEKEKDREVGRKDGVTNNPGKWNRDMVAGIMGPPAERR
jgi:hypothetical protein